MSGDPGLKFSSNRPDLLEENYHRVSDTHSSESTRGVHGKVSRRAYRSTGSPTEGSLVHQVFSLVPLSIWRTLDLNLQCVVMKTTVRCKFTFL